MYHRGFEVCHSGEEDVSICIAGFYSGLTHADHTNRAFKNWPEIFNNDATLTSAILDRILHHAETIVIEEKRYWMKDVVES